jgi:hypothetical protein
LAIPEVNTLKSRAISAIVKVAGLNAYSKGVSLWLFQPTPKEVQEQRQKMRKKETVTVDLLHRAVPAKHANEGLRALSGESPIRHENVKQYLEGKFGAALEFWGTHY